MHVRRLAIFKISSDHELKQKTHHNSYTKDSAKESMCSEYVRKLHALSFRLPHTNITADAGFDLDAGSSHVTIATVGNLLIFPLFKVGGRSLLLARAGSESSPFLVSGFLGT